MAIYEKVIKVIEVAAIIIIPPVFIWYAWYYVSLPKPEICHHCHKRVSRLDYSTWHWNEGFGSHFLCSDYPNCERFEPLKKSRHLSGSLMQLVAYGDNRGLALVKKHE